MVGIVTILILRLTSRYTPKLPGPLIALTLVGGAVYLLEPGGVAVLGEIPSGLPSLSFPTLGFWTWVDLFGTATAIAVLTIAEGLLVAGDAARRHEDLSIRTASWRRSVWQTSPGPSARECRSERAPHAARPSRQPEAAPRCRPWSVSESW
jgi:hypothetical protein